MPLPKTPRILLQSLVLKQLSVSVKQQSNNSVWKITKTSVKPFIWQFTILTTENRSITDEWTTMLGNLEARMGLMHRSLYNWNKERQCELKPRCVGKHCHEVTCSTLVTTLLVNDPRRRCWLIDDVFTKRYDGTTCEESLGMFEVGEKNNLYCQCSLCAIIMYFGLSNFFYIIWNFEYPPSKSWARVSCSSSGEYFSGDGNAGILSILPCKLYCILVPCSSIPSGTMVTHAST